MGDQSAIFSKSRCSRLAVIFRFIMVWRLGEKPVVLAPASEEPETKSLINLRNSLRAGNLSGSALEEAHSKLEELGLTDEKQRSAFIASSKDFLTELDSKRAAFERENGAIILNKAKWIVDQAQKGDPNKAIHQPVQFDPRFPNTNQTKNCWQNFVDYHRCIKIKGEDYEPCIYFKNAYGTLCPGTWVDKWTAEVEEGTFAGKI